VAQKLAAVSVDLDEVDCYTAIHGLDSEAVPAHAVYDRALPRLLSLFEELEVPATFFAIGRDLARAENAARLRELHRAGHEIANHSLNHHYDLTRRPPDEQRREVEGGADAVEAAVGARPVGFRAPGYTITDSLFRVLEASGAVYDSSVFPCPAYYLAKTAAIAWIGLRGRKSHSVVDDPRVLFAPADPYAVGRPYYRRGAGLLELPIGVTGEATGRLPFIGTSVVLSGPTFARRLTALAAARSFVNLELHGIDLADAQQDGLGGLAAHQPDLRRSAADKRAALRASIEALRERGYKFVTLRKAARLLR
jgi:peptidoglycan/xylan/chitin deacetylase (PgdA/CDA1 family)